MRLLVGAALASLVLHSSALGQTAQTFGTTLKEEGIRDVVTMVISEVRADKEGVLAQAEIRVTSVSEGFPGEMVKRISPVEVIDLRQAKKELTDGFRSFLYAFVEFVAVRTPREKRLELKLHERDVEPFLKERPEDHCGFIPCDLAKCCPNCKPKPCEKTQ